MIRYENYESVFYNIQQQQYGTLCSSFQFKLLHRKTILVNKSKNMAIWSTTSGPEKLSYLQLNKMYRYDQRLEITCARSKSCKILKSDIIINLLLRQLRE